MKHNEGTFKGFGGLELYTQSWLPDTPPKAIMALVHGFGEHSGRYKNVVNHLVPKGYAIYGFDHRGHGRSPGKRGHVNDWAEFRGDVVAFKQFITGQHPDLPLFLMGHSMGGLIVLEYILRHPEGWQGVIASAPLLGQPNISPALIFISRLLSRVWPSLGVNTGLDASTISRDETEVEAYQNDPLVHSMGTPRTSTEMTTAVTWTQAHAADINLPLLIIHGQADALISPEDSAAFFANVTYPDKQRILYDGGFHESHNDIHHEQVTADLEQWLEAHL